MVFFLCSCIYDLLNNEVLRKLKVKVNLEISIFWLTIGSCKKIYKEKVNKLIYLPRNQKG